MAVMSCGSRIGDLRLLIILATALLLASFPALAQVEIGIFFDEAGTIATHQTTAPFELVTAYVVLQNSGPALDIDGFEFRVAQTGSFNNMLMAPTLLLDGLNLGNEEEFVVALSNNATLDGSLAVASFQVFAESAAQEINLFLEPAWEGTFTPHDPEGTGYDLRLPLIHVGNDPQVAEPINCIHLPQALINDDGLAADPVLSGWPASQDFVVGSAGGSQEQTFTLTNDGPVSFRGVLTPTGPEFTVRQNSGPDVTVAHSLFLPPGGSVTVTSTFTAPATGEFTGSLGLDACGLSTWSADLLGHCGTIGCLVEPTALDFGSLIVGQADTLDVLLTNTGDTPLSLAAASDNSEFSWFVDAGSDPDLLPVGGQLTLHVVYAPVTEAVQYGTLSLGNAACADVTLSGTGLPVPAACELAPGSLDFGTVLVGEHADCQFGVTNTGGGILSGALDTAGLPAGFSLVDADPTYAVAGGDTHTFTLRFAPLVAGTLEAQLDAGTPCGLVALTGLGEVPQPPLCELDATSLDFGTVLVGQGSSRTLRITNVGGGTLAGDLVVTGDSAPYNVLGLNDSYSLEAGESVTFTVLFYPEEDRVYNASLDVGSNCGTVPLTGAGTLIPPPSCQVLPGDLDFGTVLVGQSADLLVGVANTGGGLLEGSLDLSAAPPEIVLVEADPSFSVAGGDTQSFTLRFTPVGEGAVNGLLDVGPGCGALNLDGVGELPPPPVCELSTSSLDFGEVLVGESALLSLEIANTGGDTLRGTPDLSGLPGAFLPTSPWESFALTEGQSVAYTLEFAPTAEGPYSGQIDVGTACGLVSVSGTGTLPPPPSVTLITPNGGETWTFGQAEPVQWTTTHEGPYSLHVEISLDGGGTWRREYSDLPCEGDLNGMIRAIGPPSTDCLLRIVTPDGSMSDVSDAPFTIVAGPGYQVLTPNGGESYDLGSDVTIEWLGDAALGEVMIEYISEHTGDWTAIGTAPAGDGSLVWNTSVQPGTGYEIRVRNQPAEGETLYYDRSNRPFTVASGPYLALNAPAAGDTLFNGRPLELSWTDHEVTAVDLEARTKGGGAWQTLLADTPADGQETWTAAFPGPGQYELRLADPASSATSAIVGPVTVLARQLTLEQPAAGAVFLVGEDLPLQWSAVGVDSVALDFSLDDGGSWTEIIDQAPATGTATWPLTGDASEDCRVRVRCIDAQSAPLEALNPGPFAVRHGLTITEPWQHQAFTPGQTATLRWTDSGITAVDIELSRDNGQTWTTLETGLPSSGSYDWPVALPTGSNNRFRVSESGGSASAISDAFRIYLADALTARPASIDFGVCTYQDGAWAPKPADLVITNASADSCFFLIYNFLPDVEVSTTPAPGPGPEPGPRRQPDPAGHGRGRHARHLQRRPGLLRRSGRLPLRSGSGPGRLRPDPALAADHPQHGQLRRGGTGRVQRHERHRHPPDRPVHHPGRGGPADTPQLPVPGHRRPGALHTGARPDPAGGGHLRPRPGGLVPRRHRPEPELRRHGGRIHRGGGRLPHGHDGHRRGRGHGGHPGLRQPGRRRDGGRGRAGRFHQGPRRLRGLHHPRGRRTLHPGPGPEPPGGGPVPARRHHQR
jgi:hypothetical protein